MQKEIMKRTKLYGVTAIILAIILGAFCFTAGILPPTIQLPSPQASLSAFASYDDLRSYVVANSKYYVYIPSGVPQSDVMLFAGEAGLKESSSLDTQHSNTNVQVAGVDEADIVKTDGEYIYVVSGNNVTILRAYPPENAEILSKINVNNSYNFRIFVNGDKLAILGNAYRYFGLHYGPYLSFPGEMKIFPPQYDELASFVYVYDVSDKANPTLVRNFTISGNYFNSRMIGDYVYFVAE